jgi:hypothetical protein
MSEQELRYNITIREKMFLSSKNRIIGIFPDGRKNHYYISNCITCFDENEQVIFSKPISTYFKQFT